MEEERLRLQEKHLREEAEERAAAEVKRRQEVEAIVAADAKRRQELDDELERLRIRLANQQDETTSE